MAFQKIEVENWDRKPFFDFYEDYDLPYIIMTADADVTNVLAFAKKEKVSFNLAMVYLCNKTADSILNFRYRFKDREAFLIPFNRPVINHLVPGQDIFVAADGIWPCDDMAEFCRTTHARFDGLSSASFADAVGGEEDIINYTAIPWVRYTQMFRTIRRGGKDNNPKISFAKYYKEGDRVLMPVSVQTHHALMDGYHVGQFYIKLQQLIDEME